MPCTDRSERPPTLLRYGEHPDQVADLWLPAVQHAAPLVVVVHGGNWKQPYDRAHTAPMCAALAAAGYAVAGIEYRRVGGGGSGGTPATFDDLAVALDSLPGLAAAAAPDSVDGGTVVLVGHSAGGHLALWASSRHALPAGSRWSAPRPLGLAGVVALGAVSDLAGALRADQGDGSVQALVAGCADAGVDVAELDPAVRPGHGVPTILVHGADDDEVPVAWSVEHADRLRLAGTPVELQVLAATGHYEVIDPGTPAWTTVLRSVERVAAGVTTL